MHIAGIRGIPLKLTTPPQALGAPVARLYEQSMMGQCFEPQRSIATDGPSLQQTKRQQRLEY